MQILNKELSARNLISIFQQNRATSSYKQKYVLFAQINILVTFCYLDKLMRYLNSSS